MAGVDYNMVLRVGGDKVGMPDPFRPVPFKPAQKWSGAGWPNLDIRAQNSSPPVYWRGGTGWRACPPTRLPTNKRADLSFEPGHLSWPTPLRPTFERA